jgi:hypothetical protein
MQVTSIDTYLDPSLGGKTSIHFEIGTMHVHTTRVHKALATIFCRVTPYNFELLFLSFLHCNIRAARILRFSVKFADPSYINCEREEASEYLQHVLFVACS